MHFLGEYTDTYYECGTSSLIYAVDEDKYGTCETIHNWDDWTQCYCDTDLCFEPDTLNQVSI